MRKLINTYSYHEDQSYSIDKQAMSEFGRRSLFKRIPIAPHIFHHNTSDNCQK